MSTLPTAQLDSMVSSAMQQLSHLDYEELQSYLDNDEKIDALIDSIPQMRTLPTEREMHLMQNKSLAEWNLSQEPRLTEAKQRLRATYNDANKLKQTVEKLKDNLDSRSKNRSLDTTGALLQAAAQSAEDDSEAVAEKFLNNQMDADQFVAEFQPKRFLALMRKVKSEKLNEILQSQQYSRPSPHQQQPTSGVPYPMRPAPGPPIGNYWK